MRIWTILALATTMAFGCGDDDTLPVADSGPEVDANGGTDAGPDPDAGPVEEDAGPTPDAGSVGACAWNGPYGATIGARMQPVGTVAQGNDFDMQDCNGDSYAFPDQGACDAKLTVISIAAGWCGPCIAESRVLEAEINQMFDPADVHVVQVITQDADFNPPPEGYCTQWVERFGLTNTQLVDPAQLLSPFFPDNALPSTIIVDNEGLIVDRITGIEGGPNPVARLHDSLVRLLAER